MTVSSVKKIWSAGLPGALILAALAAPAHAVDLREAVQAAMASNPEINQAVQNKEAIEFEREQAQGLYLPRISVEGSAGIRRLTNPTRRAIGISNQELYPVEGDLVAEQVLFDSGARRSELKRQASRTDGAALRVEERSEFIALNVSRQYIDYLLQQRIVAAADDNVLFHEKLAGDLREGVSKGSISIADQQQAEERLQAARARRTEAQEDLENAATSFRQLTGIPIDTVTLPPKLTASVPTSLDEAIEGARKNNPRVREAEADVDAAHAVVDAAKAQIGPRISVEGRVRYGDDIDGFRGETTDLQGRVVLRWTLFDGGINRAAVQENVRRASETRYKLHEVSRQAEADARTAWTRLTNQTKLLADLETQSKVSDDLLLSYREQFNVGRRSLLDVLDAQNSRYNVQVQRETARFAQVFAEYRLLAATNTLLKALDVAPANGSNAYARAKYHVGPTPPAETMRRRLPYDVPR
jgi:outer membrane protein, adhesin transport system